MNKQDKNFFLQKIWQYFSVFSNKVKHSISLGETKLFHPARNTLIAVTLNNKNWI